MTIGELPLVTNYGLDYRANWTKGIRRLATRTHLHPAGNSERVDLNNIGYSLMLLVNASAGPSKLHGVGLIAREFIPKVTKIWVLKPGFDRLLTKDEVDTLSLASKRQVRHYSYFDEKIQRYVLSSDDDRFTNHSDTPNTKDCGEYSEAIVDIQIGEEITADYVEVGTTDFKGNGGF